MLGGEGKSSCVSTSGSLTIHNVRKVDASGFVDPQSSHKTLTKES